MEKKQEVEFEMSDIGNTYVRLNVKRDSDGVRWWSMEDWGKFEFVKIPASLYNELLDHYRNTKN